MNDTPKNRPTRSLHVSHPWHEIEPYMDASGILTAFIEIVPGAGLKFELDKSSGWLRIDRPQKFASRPPVMYGFIPQTYCGARVGQRCSESTGLTEIVGDGDPMDILVLSEQFPTHGGFLVHARVIGGLRMIDSNEADDKIVAVLKGDPVYGGFQQIGEVSSPVVDGLIHYFTTYKQPPREANLKVTIHQMYDREEAEHTLALSLADYNDHFSAEPL
jgi:inorganic pyrophosphatase